MEKRIKEESRSWSRRQTMKSDCGGRTERNGKGRQDGKSREPKEEEAAKSAAGRRNRGSGDKNRGVKETAKFSQNAIVF